MNDGNHKLTFALLLEQIIYIIFRFDILIALNIKSDEFRGCVLDRVRALVAFDQLGNDVNGADFGVVLQQDHQQVTNHLLQSYLVNSADFKVSILEVGDFIIWIFIRLKTIKMRLNLNGLLAGLLHFNHF